MPELTRLYSEEELRILGEIVKHANASSGASDSPLRSTRTSQPSLIEVLKAYDVVLRKEGVDPDSDTFFYRTVLRMSLDPSGNWWDKLENERRVRHTRCSESIGPAGNSLQDSHPRESQSSYLHLQFVNLIVWQDNEMEFAAQVVAASRSSGGSTPSRNARSNLNSVSRRSRSRSSPPSKASSGGVLGDSLRSWMDHAGIEGEHASRDRASAPSSNQAWQGHDAYRPRDTARSTAQRRHSGVGVPGSAAYGAARSLQDPPPPPPPPRRG